MTDFEGPLTLILLLLSKDKVEIRDISVSLILEQYLAYLDEMAELNLDIASEFVAMASHLTFIKTKVLLSVNDEEISELEQLITSLEELRRCDVYLQIKSVTEDFSEMYRRGAGIMPGPPEYLPPNLDAGYRHGSEDIVNAIIRVIGRDNIRLGSLNPKKPVYPGRIMYSISEKTMEIMDKMRQVGQIDFISLFDECGSRSEVVATLIALLELCKAGSLFIFSDNEELVVSYKSDFDEASYDAGHRSDFDETSHGAGYRLDFDEANHNAGHRSDFSEATYDINRKPDFNERNHVDGHGLGFDEINHYGVYSESAEVAAHG